MNMFPIPLKKESLYSYLPLSLPSYYLEFVCASASSLPLPSSPLQRPHFSLYTVTESC